MIVLHEEGGFLLNGRLVLEGEQVRLPDGSTADKKAGRKGTMAYQILKSHNRSENMEQLNIRFDKLTSHDITYVGIIQTARASGLEKFPMPYVLTNCHNSLCAVGGTINEDDHMFGLSCAKKYGGIYVPAHQAVIHQYAREMLAESGAMILGSDSHTRYGALGTMAIGEGGPELVKQLLGQTYDVKMPAVVGVYLKGKLKKGVGPQDIALAIIGAVFKNGFVNNCVMEFIGEGIGNLTVDERIGVDVMTTETTCLSSIWQTDASVKEFYEIHGRPEAYRALAPAEGAYYDRIIEVDLDKIECMIAMPFHPSNVYTIHEVMEHPADILAECEKTAIETLHAPGDFSLRSKIKNGALMVDQGIVAGCAGGGFENICAAADILKGRSIGNGAFTMSVYPASMPVYMELVKNGVAADLMASGVVMKTAFCGPCFGAGDTPANNALSIRHSTRNFPNREGSKVQNSQMSGVALMDARSIAATAARQGALTAATDLDTNYQKRSYYFDKSIYENRVFDSHGVASPETEIVLGPNIKDWPKMPALTKHLLLKVVSVIEDPVTTTDELIPSGETSSYRSNPLGLAEFALSRRDPAYVGRAKEIFAAEQAREVGDCPAEAVPELKAVFARIAEVYGEEVLKDTGIGSTIYARKPGDGSAREQAASCQKVLGGWANLAKEYATKRYRSNLINWGMLPFLFDEEKLPFVNGDYIFVPDAAAAVRDKTEEIKAYIVGETWMEITLKLGSLTEEEREIILDGCLINHHRKAMKG